MRYFIRVLSFFLFIQTFMHAQIPHDDWQRVYLATYERSGNHWLRNLLEEATHIATSTVYRDKEPLHLAKPFPWGGYAAEYGCEGNCRYPNPGEIVVIKTHFPAKPKTKFDLKPAIKVIRIVRHPVDTFYSHFLHRGRKLPSDGKIPSWYVEESIARWRRFENYWNRQADVFTIRYEDLLTNPHLYFRKVLKAIGYQLSEEDINRAIEKFPPQGDTLKHLEDYHSKDLKLISHHLGSLMKRHDYKIDKVNNLDK